MDNQSEKPLVLIVEDETDIRNMINMLVKSSGFRSIAVASGEEGLEMARKHKPMVMTLDRMLPGIDGLEVCRQLRVDAEIAETYVIMVLYALLALILIEVVLWDPRAGMREEVHEA